MSEEAGLDPLREAQARAAQEGALCRQFLNGIGGAALKQMREATIDQLTALPQGRRFDDSRYRLSVALKVITGLSDTILRCAEEGAECEAELKKWLELQKGSIFDVRR